MEELLNFKQDEHVLFDDNTVKGTGKIKGVSSTGVTILGRGYIIELDDPE